MTAEPGRCLCGDVRFTARPKQMEMSACHCSMCRRWSGGVFLSVECDQVAWGDESALAVHASSDWAERCFCRTCGSTIAWRTKDRSLLAVSVQAFEHPERFAFTSQIFIDEKPATYSFRETTQTMTGAQVMAAFPPAAAGQTEGKTR